MYGGLEMSVKNRREEYHRCLALNIKVSDKLSAEFAPKEVIKEVPKKEKK